MTPMRHLDHPMLRSFSLWTSLLAGASLPGCSTSEQTPTTSMGSSGSTGSNPAESESSAGQAEGDSTVVASTSSSTATSLTDPGSTTEGTTSSTTSGTSGTSGATSTSETSGTTEQATTEGDSTQLAMRTMCSEAPPAGPVANPVQDVFNLAVSKETYQQMILEQEPFQGTRGTLPWNLYQPAQAATDPDTRFPLVVVLHGGYGMERENGNILFDAAQYLLGSSNGLLTEENRQQYPAYIIAPHCIDDEGCAFGSNEWSSQGGAFYAVQPQPSVAGGTAIELVEHMIATYQVDPARVYVTGNSMGGGGTWEFVQRRPDLFAAGVPVAGHTPSLTDLNALAASKVPVWAFTGALDEEINSHLDTDQAVAHLVDAGGCAWVTKYAGTGHDDVLWANPYLHEGLWPWLFAQKIPTVGEPGAGEPFPMP